MPKLIERLWGGNLAPSERSGAGSTEIQRSIEDENAILDKFEKILTDEGKAVLLDYEAQKNASASYACMEAFCDGFSLGIRLIVEALTGAEKLI